MDFDFNLILVPVTLVFFFIWVLDKLVFKQRKTQGKGNENFVISWAYDFWPVLGLVLFVRSFIIEPYNIPSSSMVPTLYTGDFIVVKKYAYGIKLPLAHTKILDTGTPERGDVTVFRYPEQPSIYFIKRMIGLPGDTISFNDNQLTINGKVVATAEQPQADLDAFSTVFTETLDNKTHLIRDLDGVWSSESALFLRNNNPNVFNTGKQWQIKVPQGQYFVMGDNRDESADSRWWGFVPDKNLSGKAVYVWMHKKPGLHLPSFSQARAIQ